MTKNYEVEFEPLIVLVKAENKDEAEELAREEIASGELIYELKEIRTTKEEL